VSFLRVLPIAFAGGRESPLYCAGHQEGGGGAGGDGIFFLLLLGKKGKRERGKGEEEIGCSSSLFSLSSTTEEKKGGRHLLLLSEMRKKGREGAQGPPGRLFFFSLFPLFESRGTAEVHGVFLLVVVGGERGEGEG